ncbi:apolipoprotein A1/A4/E family protein [Streptococcus sp. HMSC061D01]|uniref:apolipoprotein A1/A4/E family protein n=1 Tax=Streptococcus sp. HMSC061D01 TaxID=1739263 RepID=UPI0021C1C2E9|nr:apolipoprotein A1/A4/E family protein [Streptococcus sp. HMSC061D01]
MIIIVTFEQAMLARDRTFAIRVGKYQTNDIKEASFDYGYIKGDTFKPGGTCAGSAKVTFTSIITTFKKLDKVYPEIGLLVGNAYEWVKMGEYFINDIEIDRNRNLTTLDLMDGMFKFNKPFETGLSYPAQIRDVIREICAKTGVTLQTDNLGLRAIQHHIQKKPDKKDITYREVLSQAVQLLGFSAFFNRDGKLEIRGLTESNITITADSYFLHGLTRSETEYQIAGITCKKTDKEVLTVGLRTGRSLELENSFMNQNLLDALYYDLKNLKYYPFNLNYQGHLKLQVGQWVTIKTNKNETFKVPVLNQSFKFQGGLSARISADSKAGNDAQYSYGGFYAKRIEQANTDMAAEVQQQLEWAEKEFDKKQKDLKDEIKTGIEQAKAKAEQVKSEINQSIEQKLQQTKSEVVEKVKQDFNQGLANANAEIGKVKQNLTNLQSSAEANIKQVKSDLAGIRTQQTTYEQSNEQNLARITGQLADKASKAEVKQEAGKIREEISQISVGGKNLLKGSKGEFKPDRNPSNFDNWQVFYASEIYFEEGKQYIISGKTDGIFSNNHQSLIESDNVVLWFLNKSWTVTQIVSGPDTGTIGTKFIWNNPTGIYCLRVNTYHKDARKKVWEVKVEQGTIKTDWSPAPEDTDEQITAARTTFEKTAEGLKTDMTAVKSYVADDGKRREQLEQYTRTETARSTEALRKQVSESYVAKSQHREDIRGIARRFEELVIGGNNLLAYANLNEGGYYQNALKQDPAYIYSNLIEIKNKNYCLQVWELRSIEKKNWVGIQYFDDTNKPTANGYVSIWFNGYRKQLLKVPSTAKYIAISLDKRALNKDEIKFKLELGSIPSDWSPAPEDSKNYTNTKLAEYKQTVDGEFKKLQSSVGEMVKKTDINITPGQISFGTGKVVNGKTIASLFVQNPESIEAITKLMRITGDLIVDGSITGRNLAANTITTAHLAAGAVTTEVLAADAVTADKLRVDYALINKLTADDALLNNLVAKQGFINKLSTIDFSATQIKGGILKSLNNVSIFDLQRAVLTFKREDEFTTVFNRNGLYLERQNKKILGLTYKEYSAHSNFTNNVMAEFEFDNDASLAFSTSEFASVFMEIYPKKETIYIRSGFKLYFGEGQSVALEHVYGTLNGVDYSAFRVLGTDRDELRFFRDGRIELYHKQY